MIPRLSSFILLTALTAFAADTNMLERWRPQFEALENIDQSLRQYLVESGSPISNHYPDTENGEKLNALAPIVDGLIPKDGESLLFPPIHGPETPFPDHAPLVEIAKVRLALIKLAWMEQDHTRALHLANQNLDFTRATLEAQQGLVPVITATGIWQTALDGVYWLARQPELSSAAAAALQSRLVDDNTLGARALISSFNGEYTFIQKVIIERLPVTHDPELLLESIGSLGMVPPTGSHEEGMPRLPVIERTLLDQTATLALSQSRVSDYTTALADDPLHHPADIWMGNHLRTQQKIASELGALLRYATTDEEATPALMTDATAVLHNVENPVGKLYILIATPHWNPVSETVFRRQAQNSALQILLAWRRHGKPAPVSTLVESGLLKASPADPFSKGPLMVDPERARVWSIGPDGVDNGGEGDGENIGRPADYSWPIVF